MKLGLDGLLVFLSMVAGCQPVVPGAVVISDEMPTYCIVVLVPEEDAFDAVAQELVRLHHNAPLLRATPTSLRDLLPPLKQIDPEYVAVVVRPDDLDINLVRQWMLVSSEVDADPFVDFAYGFVTGESPEAAMKLVQAGQGDAKDRFPSLVQMGVMEGSFLKRSQSTQQALPLRRGTLAQTAHMIVKGANEERDETYLQKTMPKLDGESLLLFAGHGFPREVVGGPTFEHLHGRKFPEAVALNIACYTGVTHRWYEEDWSTLTLRERTVPAQESFCLNMINTGVGGYVAYACPRPSGPTLFGDAIAIATSGNTLGELRRRDANSVVLSHLQQGYDSLHIDIQSEGTPLDRNRSVQALLVQMSTGGMLVGDPMFRPFAGKPDADPRQVQLESTDSGMRAKVTVAGPLWHFFCSDQVTMWDETNPSMRIEFAIPWDDRGVRGLRVVSSSFGEVPHRWLAVMEEHRGKRWLHVKVTSKQPAMESLTKIGTTGVSATLEIDTNDSKDQGAILLRGEVLSK